MESIVTNPVMQYPIKIYDFLRIYISNAIQYNNMNKKDVEELSNKIIYSAQYISNNRPNQYPPEVETFADWLEFATEGGLSDISVDDVLIMLKYISDHDNYVYVHPELSVKVLIDSFASTVVHDEKHTLLDLIEKNTRYKKMIKTLNNYYPNSNSDILAEIVNTCLDKNINTKDFDFSNSTDVEIWNSIHNLQLGSGPSPRRSKRLMSKNHLA